MLAKFFNFIFGQPIPSDRNVQKRSDLLGRKNLNTPFYKDTLNYALCFSKLRKLHIQKMLSYEEYEYMPIYKKIRE